MKINPNRSEKSDCDIVVAYIIGDGSVAAITFSVIGHTVEGVQEFLAARWGNVVRFHENEMPGGCSVDYVWEVGNLFPKTREALENNRENVIHACPHGLKAQ